MKFSILQIHIFTTDSFKLVGYVCVQKYIYAHTYTDTQTHTHMCIYIYTHRHIQGVGFGIFLTWLLSCFMTVNDAFVCF